MSIEITEDMLIKLAHDMVATGNLNTLYGLDPFLKARALFETTLKAFVIQLTQSRLHSEIREEVSIITIQPPIVKSVAVIKTNIDNIPDFLKQK